LLSPPFVESCCSVDSKIQICRADIRPKLIRAADP
jgi:hypothetical protein